MSDIKTVYHHSVILNKIKAIYNGDLRRAVQNALKRKLAFGKNWQKININDFVAKFTPNPNRENSGNKIYFTGKDKKYRIVADKTGGYCRLEDYQYYLQTGKHLYLDIDGNDVKNYKDANGKQHGRKKSDFNKITHFKILHREEMQK